MIVEWSRILVNWMQDTVRWIYLQLKYTISKILISITIFIALLWVALFVYGSFYYVYMPSVSHERPCNFVFDVCDNGVGVCSFPKARVDLTDESNRYVLSSGQAYKIMLVLEIPESTVNQKTGMFLVKAHFYNQSNHYIQSAAKTTMLRYRSSLLHTMSTLFYLPFLITGANEEKQILHVELFSKYTEDPYNRAVGVDFLILHRHVQLYSAVVKIYAHFTGLRYLMFNWPVSCAVAGTGIILTLLILCALFAWYNYFNSGYILQPSSHRMLLEERRRHMHARLLLEGRPTPNPHTSVPNIDTSQRAFQVSSVELSTVSRDLSETVHRELPPSAESIGSTVTTLSLHNVSSSSTTGSADECTTTIHSNSSNDLADENTSCFGNSDPQKNARSSNEGDFELRQRHTASSPYSSS
ncbi:seipin [Octopus bimaculoides]|uniref:Seipin n=1 Tax=Octopus bimaculoides TaxID=37653 RepID=A0A0L8GCN9_OCTBM|nr:seipin [Octopus bimaculoides]|eukprot:XP_014782125.1 PREDICTED: seipin-like [Octopus bimaculoides]